ncbi:hypothetical protein C8R43DRAFT_1119651 [Mycena crocata]|nr:hypothetical protein C8R43DRAFT_1119651 [Mycena crocata]
MTDVAFSSARERFTEGHSPTAGDDLTGKTVHQPHANTARPPLQVKSLNAPDSWLSDFSTPATTVKDALDRMEGSRRLFEEFIGGAGIGDLSQLCSLYALDPNEYEYAVDTLHAHCALHADPLQDLYTVEVEEQTLYPDTLLADWDTVPHFAFKEEVQRMDAKESAWMAENSFSFDSWKAPPATDACSPRDLLPAPSSSWQQTSAAILSGSPTPPPVQFLDCWVYEASPFQIQTAFNPPLPSHFTGVTEMQSTIPEMQRTIPLASREISPIPLTANPRSVQREPVNDPLAYSEAVPRSQRLQRDRKNGWITAHGKPWCRRPPDMDVATVVARTKPLHTHGICLWDGTCNTQLSLSPDDVQAHLRSAHLPDETPFAPQSFWCNWPGCAKKAAGLRVRGMKALVKHVRTGHFGTELVRCPFCPEDKMEPLADKRALSEHLLPRSARRRIEVQGAGRVG